MFLWDKVGVATDDSSKLPRMPEASPQSTNVSDLPYGQATFWIPSILGQVSPKQMLRWDFVCKWCIAEVSERNQKRIGVGQKEEEAKEGQGLRSQTTALPLPFGGTLGYEIHKPRQGNNSHTCLSLAQVWSGWTWIPKSSSASPGKVVPVAWGQSSSCKEVQVLLIENTPNLGWGARKWHNTDARGSEWSTDVVYYSRITQLGAWGVSCNTWSQPSFVISEKSHLGGTEKGQKHFSGMLRYFSWSWLPVVLISICSTGWACVGVYFPVFLVWRKSVLNPIVFMNFCYIESAPFSSLFFWLLKVFITSRFLFPFFKENT